MRNLLMTCAAMAVAATALLPARAEACSAALCRSVRLALPRDISAPAIGFAPGTKPHHYDGLSLADHHVRLFAADGGEVPLVAGAADPKWPAMALMPTGGLNANEAYVFEFTENCPAEADPLDGPKQRSFTFVPTGPAPVPTTFGVASLANVQVMTVSTGGTGQCEPGSLEAAVATFALHPSEEVKPFLANAALGVTSGSEWRWTPPGYLRADGGVGAVQIAPRPHPPWIPNALIHPCSSPHRYVGEVSFTVHIPGAEADPEAATVAFDFGCPGQTAPHGAPSPDGSVNAGAGADAGADAGPADTASGSGCTSTGAPGWQALFAAAASLLWKRRRSRF